MSSLAEVERALLATAMARPSDVAGIELDPDHFTSEAHGLVWQAVQSLTAGGEVADAVAVMDSLERQGRSALATLALRIGSEGSITSQVGAYADRLKSAWRCRRGGDIARELSERLAARDESAVDAAVAALMDLHRIQRGAEWTMKQAAKAMFARLSAVATGQASPGVPTGISKLDNVLGGLHDSDLVVIGARPAMGKTAFLLNIARHAAKSGLPVGIISGEQPYEQVGGRVLSLASNVAASKMRTAGFADEEWARISVAMAEMADLPAWILDRSNPSIAEVVRVARRWKHQHGIRALYVDYLQRIQGTSERRHEEVGQVAKALKNLARELQIPVIALAQVGRQVEARQDKRPGIGDLSDSSEIEKEADQILMLYRDEVYNQQSKDAGTAEIIVGKNRHGETGFVRCAWVGATMRFADLHEGPFS